MCKTKETRRFVHAAGAGLALRRASARGPAVTDVALHNPV